MMQDIPSLLLTMKERVDGWKSTGDRRHVFLGCYSMMSQAMHEAVNKGQFFHAPWVSQLLIRFSEYYFDALKHYDQNPELSPMVWRQVHDASKDPEINVIQNLLLGVNAHINYDLPLALYDCLAENWFQLPETHKQTLKKDHELVNEIIAQTIDSVQDSIVNPSSWSMAALDIIMCRADEWLLSKLISSWRNEVWQVNLQLLSSPGQEHRDRIRKEQEILVTHRGKQFISYL
ncbi:DUF5995 family protein [Cyclobacterium jeungdonense]|uniref:DUF5995 family protein n=1 Tax=Cyclobacterium jeungdonense TaxID=708087 RepID=A0ABT8C4E0_9BACT|nr:DUF5995 family protein [Cyclobacterium jeungdonense]MDN3687653.1 DUF5995 family protein [Cyclobacterium jeungdonense]